MAIEKMSLVSIDGDIRSIDDAMLKCAQNGNFHPEQLPDEGDAGSFATFSQTNPYQSLLKKISEIGMHAGIDLESMEREIDRLHISHIDDLSGKINRIKTLKGEIAKLIARNEGEEIVPEEALTYPLLKFRIGRIPNRAARRLKRTGRDDCLLQVFPKDRRFSWCAYVTTVTKSQAVDIAFAEAGFERIIVPQDILTNLGAIKEYEEQYEEFDLNHEEVSAYMDEFDSKILDMNKKRNQIAKHVALNEQALIQLSHIEGLDVTFDELFSCEYVKIRFGRLPKDSYHKLGYYDEQLFLFYVFDNDDEYYWGVYFTPITYEKKVDAIFTALFFERIRIPDYVHGTPEESRQNIMRALREGKERLAKITNELTTTVNKRKLYFYWLYAKVKYLSDSFDMRKYVSVYNDMFHLVGFVPEREAKRFKESFGDIRDVSVTLRPSDSEPRLTPPTKLRNNRFTSAFEMFTEMYGLPAYEEIDPTPFVAVTYTLLFGAMFGDLGQGLLMCLLGVILWKWKRMQLGRVMQRIGISSAIFGLAYGSVFGFEELLDPMFHALGFEHKPIHIMDSGTTNVILLSAVGAGIVLILISITINIYASLKQRNYARGIFSQNGLVGLILYGTAIVGAVSMLLLDINVFHPLVIALGIVAPLLIIFLKEPIGELVSGKRQIHLEGGIGSFILESFFELFEIVLSFVTNTLSFLRVGGFVLSHAGMMSVVFSLSSMVSGGGNSPMVVIIGNLFVMALEGLIVGIQTLRLEFYEMFSRFMEKNGKDFEPIKLGEVHSAN